MKGLKLFYIFFTVVFVLALFYSLTCLGSARANIQQMTGSAMIAFLILAILALSISFLDLKTVSPYKSISGALNLPGAKIVHEACSPLAVVQVVQAEGLRSTAGLSLKSLK